MVSIPRTVTTMAACLGLTLTAVGSLSSPAHADTTRIAGAGAVQIPNRFVSVDTCADVPVRYDFRSLPAGSTWTLELDAFGINAVYDFGPAGATGTTRLLWCPVDGYGPYRVNGTLNVIDEDDVETSHEISLRGSVVKPASKVTLYPVGHDYTPDLLGAFDMRGCVTVLGDRDANRDVVLQRRYPKGKWHSVKDETGLNSIPGRTVTGTKGCYSIGTYSDVRGTVWFRVRVAGSDGAKSTHSKSVRVRFGGRGESV